MKMEKLFYVVLSNIEYVKLLGNSVFCGCRLKLSIVKKSGISFLERSMLNGNETKMKELIN